MTSDTSLPVGPELLVVDDNPATRYATSRVLRAAGYRVREAGNGTDALQLADQDVAGVVLDVHLPDMNGFEVCRILRERTVTARLPIIHLSAAYMADIDKVRGLHSGADAYMTHPAEPALLIATLQALIRARTAEEGMRRSEARFRAIYNQAPSGIALIDTAGRFAEANPAMLTLLRRPGSAVVGRPLADFASPEWRDRIADGLAQSRRGVWRGDFPLLAAGGEAVPLEWSLSAHVEPGVVLAIATDISERLALSRQREDLLEREQAARAAAERLNRSKDEFIAVLSHELRTPLNAIVGWVHVLKRPDGARVMARGLESIERNAHIQTRLVSDILDMSRMDLGKLRLDFEPVDVTELVHTAVSTLGASIRDRSLDVVIDMDRVTRPLVADPSRLQQVVWNLLTNAVKFSDAGGVIRITGDQDADRVSLTVEDSGQGIRPEFLGFLFDRFTQGDSGSNRYHGGLGLGLSIVKQLVELHGGTVQAFSEGPGQGASFVVTVPMGLAVSPRAAPRPGPVPLETPDRVLTSLHLLVVDDDDEARDMLQMILSERGATVTTARTCAEALAQLAVEPRPDLLISDIGMPGQDGYDLIQAVRRDEAGTGRHLPAIALTAFARSQDRDVALGAGFDEHCGKPLRPAALVAAIERVAALSPKPR